MSRRAYRSDYLAQLIFPTEELLIPPQFLFLFRKSTYLGPPNVGELGSTWGKWGERKIAKQKETQLGRVGKVGKVGEFGGV